MFDNKLLTANRYHEQLWDVYNIHDRTYNLYKTTVLGQNIDSRGP
jgi:hypothetical protein